MKAPFLFAGLCALCGNASAQLRVSAVDLPVSAPSFVGAAAAGSVLAAAPALTVAPLLAAPSLSAAPAAAPALTAALLPASLPSALPALPAPALPAAALPAFAPAASAPEAPSGREQLSAAAAAPESERLWTGGMPDADARKLLNAAHWETTKFFFTSRVKLLRDMIRTQKAETAGKPRAVENLEGMWLDWRVKGYSGRVTTAGFEVADRATIRREAVKLFDKHFPKDAASRGAFRRYMDRVDAYVPAMRPSNYRKLAFAVFYELPTVAPAELPARIDAMIADEHLAGIAAHRATRQDAVVASFRAAALKSISDVNATMAAGKKIVAVIMLGSYAIGQSTPKSDIDYQLMTEDGSPAAIAPFAAALDKNWTENKLEKIEAFQFALPPSRALVVESFKEGYQVISPDPAAVTALSKDSFAPDPANSWSHLRGAAFAAFYRAWCWSYLRLSDLAAAFR